MVQQANGKVDRDRRVLLVKMSSLGDVIHTLPAVSDAARHGYTFDWVVEEAFAAIPAQHPAVSNVLPIAWRRWRQNLAGNAGNVRRFVKLLREESYDQVLDAQGLIKSAVVTALSRSEFKAGFSASSAKERWASLFYSRGMDVPKGSHAVNRLRRLFAAVLNYPLGDSVDEFGLENVRHTLQRDSKGDSQGSPSVIFLHGTTWQTKHWPEYMWADLTNRFAQIGYRVLLPWGSREEQDRARRIASTSPGAQVLGKKSLAELMEVVGGVDMAVGTDSGLSHLAGALGVPTVVIYGSTDPALTGCRGASVVNLQADFPCAPCRLRDCGYTGAQRLWREEVVHPACYATISPDHVWQRAEQLHAERA